VILSTLLGIGLDLLNSNPLKAVFYTAVINGVLEPFLLVGIVVAASDQKLMQDQPSSWLLRIIVGLTTIAILAAAAAMLIL
jgi:Mn2+/Fe2+ NRAMP family transporter